MHTSLYSVAIFVNDIDRALHFYGEVLGFPLEKSGSFGGEFFSEGTHLSVHPANHPEAKALVGRHTGITVRVEGLLHFCGELHDQGVTFLAEPTQQAWGIMAMIKDPDGNILALWEDKLPDDANRDAVP